MRFEKEGGALLCYHQGEKLRIEAWGKDSLRVRATKRMQFSGNEWALTEDVEKGSAQVINKGEADFIVSFELLEAARWTEFLKPGGKIIVNTQQINPMPVIIGAAQYPENLLEKMNAAGLDVDALDALSLAEAAGSSKAVNIVLMGHLSRYFDFTEEEWLEALEQSVAPKFLEMNKKAFAMGRNA